MASERPSRCRGFGATGQDSRNYFDAYIGVFTDSPATSFIEAGVGFYGEKHRDKDTGKWGAAVFPHHWSTLLNPIGGALIGQPAQGQRNALYNGGPQVALELMVTGPNQASFLVNGSAFRNAPSFTFGFGGTGIEQPTFDRGLNIKACIGLNDADHTVHFKAMKIQIDQIYSKDSEGKTRLGRRFGTRFQEGVVGSERASLEERPDRYVPNGDGGRPPLNWATLSRLRTPH